MGMTWVSPGLLRLCSGQQSEGPWSGIFTTSRTFLLHPLPCVTLRIRGPLLRSVGMKSGPKAQAQDRNWMHITQNSQ